MKKSSVKEIKKLSAHKYIRNAFNLIDALNNQTTEDLITITQIEVHPSMEI